MKFIKFVSKLTVVAFACLCVGTTVAQGIGACALWAGGGLTREKLTRYAAVVYGLDLTEVPAARGGDPEAELAEELLTRDQIIDQRVSQHSLIEERKEAIRRATLANKNLFDSVRLDNARFEETKNVFDDFLEQEEQTARQVAIREVEQTLAVLIPRQSKELIVSMLEDKDVDPDDDVLGDIVTVVKSMPEAKLKKILREFKSEEELQQLHEIMAAIGDIDLN